MSKILLISAYDAASHRYWRESLAAQFSEHRWQQIFLPPRYFSWRQAGHVLSLQREYEEQLKQNYDLIVATSMTQLALLRGIYKNLASIPAVLYFHENQFDYPVQNQNRNRQLHQLNSIYSALSADQLVFNSEYNRQTWLAGADALLSKMPDFVPPDVSKNCENKSMVLPVPIPADCRPAEKPDNHQLTLVWNHRWEYDKGIDLLLMFLRQLKLHKIDFKIHIIGQVFRQQPDAFEQIKREMKSHIGHWGFVPERADYIEVLQQSDVVLSTALHEFQGLAVMEAVACGCIPLVPDRLAYQEYYPADCRYASSPENPEQEAEAMCQQLQNLIHQAPQQLITQDVSWDHLRSDYQKVLHQWL